MTRRATFTEAELTRALRAAQKVGVLARLRETDEGTVIEFTPTPDETLDSETSSGTLNQPKPW